MNKKLSETKWLIWINLFIGFWVFVLPWTVGPGFKIQGGNVVMWNFLFIGAMIISLSYLLLKKMLAWAYLLTEFTGIWLIVSPWFLFYTSHKLLVLNSLILGLLVSTTTAFLLPNLSKNKKLIYS
jgi:hypothetical protein